MSNIQLAQASADYLKELDALAKLSGEEVDTIAARNQAMLNETAFRARLEQIGLDQAKSIMMFTSQLNRFGPMGEQLAAGIRDIFAKSGAVATAEGRALFNATSGQIVNIVNRLENGTIGVAQANEELKNALKGNIGFLQSASRMNADNTELTARYVGFQDIVNAKIDEAGLLQAEVNRQQTIQIEKTDKLTGSAVEAQKAFELMNREIEKVTLNFLPGFAGMLEMGAKGFLRAVTAAAKQFGIKQDPMFELDLSQTPPAPPTETEQKQIDFQKKQITSSLEQRNIPVTDENIKIIKMFGAQRGAELIGDSPSRTLEQGGFFGIGADAAVRSMIERHTGVELPSDATVQDALNAVKNAQIPGFQMGGVVAGPKTGYTTMLHGTEAVIPMDTGQTSIPVELKGMNNSMSQQMGIMKQQLDRLDSMVHMLGRSNRAQQDMLQSSYS